MSHLLSATILLLLINTAQIPSFSVEMPSKIYLGVENPILIKMNGAQPDEISIKIVPGNYYKKNDSTFIYVANQEIGELKIKLYYKNILVETRTLPVEHIPEPGSSIRYDTEINGKISMSKLLSTSKLLLEYNTDYPIQFHNKINSYILTCKNVYGGKSALQLNSEIISEDAITLFKMLKAGDVISLSNITGRNSSNQYSNLGSKIIVISD